MTSFEGHTAKRQRTDYEAGGGGRDGFGGSGNSFYGGNNKSGGRPQYEEKPNHILLITVINPAYPITTDVIHTICSPSGKVLRIVIFKKNGVQAMVEFDSVESAERAKQSLNGCDIYSGCCTLKIEFAKPSRLNVYKNDNDSWDYTNANLTKTTTPTERPALLQEPPRGFGQGPYGDGNRGAGNTGYDGYDDGYNMPRGRDPYGPPGRDPYGQGPPDRYGRDAYMRDGSGAPPRGPNYGPNGPMPPPGSQNGAVVMAYGLNKDKMNTEKLFNVLCLYGNVVRVKFLKSKEGCAMIQMGDPLAVERVVTNLHGCLLFESKLQLGYSKQAFLNDVQQPYQLPDGTPSFKDYMGNRNNRFTNPEAASKNRILAPSKLLHFFNAPFGITEEEMKKVIEDSGAIPPMSVKPFVSKQPKPERSSSGLLEFDETSSAVEAIALCNHVPIPNPNGKFPFILKLCFSSTATRPPRGGGGPPGGNY